MYPDVMLNEVNENYSASDKNINILIDRYLELYRHYGLYELTSDKDSYSPKEWLELILQWSVDERCAALFYLKELTPEERQEELVGLFKVEPANEKERIIRRRLAMVLCLNDNSSRNLLSALQSLIKSKKI